ncbi:trans-sialidase, putative [Trypanosoma cruzi marinkellei]|uniref:Trans-sialidase, putative n=1 Tax=Trypanosoma cruzi marinkellei TaxID=85056 RepID=K2M4C2_TRYCR|nr:trans-sialidase, putative [Trypanosoma cruzi marinkellei]
MAHGPSLLTTQLSFFFFSLCFFVAVCAGWGRHGRACDVSGAATLCGPGDGCAPLARAAVGASASWRQWLLPRRTQRVPSERSARRTWWRRCVQRAGRLTGCLWTTPWGWRVVSRRALFVVDSSRRFAHWQCQLLCRGARADCPVLSGEAKSQQCFPHGIVVADAGLTASTSARTSRALLRHAVATPRGLGAGVAVPSVFHQICLRKHEKKQNITCTRPSGVRQDFMVGRDFLFFLFESHISEANTGSRTVLSPLKFLKGEVHLSPHRRIWTRIRSKGLYACLAIDMQRIYDFDPQYLLRVVTLFPVPGFMALATDLFQCSRRGLWECNKFLLLCL